MPLHLPGLGRAATTPVHGPMTPLLVVDLFVLLGLFFAVFWGMSSPNHPQVRLNWALAIVLVAATVVWAFVRARGRDVESAGAALAIAGYGLLLRVWSEFLTLLGGQVFDIPAVAAEQVPTLVLCRAAGLAAFALGLGFAAGATLPRR
jgi:hypothetical protein